MGWNCTNLTALFTKGTDVKTEHNGYEIEFSEHQDLWSCRSLELSDKSLKRLRTKINQVSAQARRLDTIPLLSVTSYNDKVSPVTGVLIDSDGKNVWCLGSRWGGTVKGNAPPERFKVDATSLVHDTPEHRQIVVEAKNIEREADGLRAKARAMLEALPRIDLATMQGISQQAVSEDADD